jgi:hypothetical protein
MASVDEAEPLAVRGVEQGLQFAADDELFEDLVGAGGSSTIRTPAVSRVRALHG